MDEKEKPKRKDLRLKQYSYSTRGAYFITICTQDRKNILSHIISTFKRFCAKEIGENIFQRGYFDHIIRNREDYEKHVKYIYENPLRFVYQ